MEFENDESHVQRDLIYSNSSNSGKSLLFRASMIDTYNSDENEFIKLSGDGMSQTVTGFDVVKNFKFGIYLPNGEIFETLLKDNTSPALPNDSLQISCLFSIRRL